MDTVADLKQATQVWGLSGLDRAYSGLVLGKDGVVAYHGSHISARRHVDLTLLEDISVDGALFSGAVGLLNPDADVRLRRTGGVLEIRAENRTLTVPTLPSEEWPPFRERLDYVTVEASVFRSAVNRLGMAAGRAIGNLILSGINVELRGNTLVLRSTNGSSVAGMARVPLQSLPTRPLVGNATPMAGDIAALLTILGGTSIQIGWDANHFYVFDEVTHIEITLLSGAYPPFAHLPREFNHEVTLHTADLEAVCRAATLYDTDRIVVLSPTEGGATLATRPNERGSFTLNLDVTPPPFQMVFDATHLLAAVSGRAIKLHIRDARSPMLATSDGGSFMWVAPLII